MTLVRVEETDSGGFTVLNLHRLPPILITRGPRTSALRSSRKFAQS